MNAGLTFWLWLAVLKVCSEPLSVANNDTNMPLGASAFLLNKPNDILKRRRNALKVDFDIRKFQQNQHLLNNNANMKQGFCGRIEIAEKAFIA